MAITANVVSKVFGIIITFLTWNKHVKGYAIFLKKPAEASTKETSFATFIFIGGSLAVKKESENEAGKMSFLSQMKAKLKS